MPEMPETNEFLPVKITVICALMVLAATAVYQGGETEDIASFGVGLTSFIAGLMLLT